MALLHDYKGTTIQIVALLHDYKGATIQIVALLHDYKGATIQIVALLHDYKGATIQIVALLHDYKGATIQIVVLLHDDKGATIRIAVLLHENLAPQLKFQSKNMTQSTKISYLCTVVQQIKQIKTKNNYEKTKIRNPARCAHIRGGGKSYANDIAAANADGVTIYYNYINNQTELEVTYKGAYNSNADYEGKVVIPESVTHEGKTYPVTSIGVWAFSFCNSLNALTEVTIPGSVTSIGNNAFYSSGVLTKVTIPNSVTSIGYSAFYNCKSLTELTVPGSVTFIGDQAFSGCESLTEMTIPGSVTSIGSQVFYGCSSLTELTIPGSVTTIGNSAFYGCSSLTELTIPNSVTSIGSQVFYNCSGLEKITVESDNPNYDSRENCNAIINTNSNELILGCKNTIIPGSVTSIRGAFYGCSGLTSVTIPNSVTSIGYETFRDCIGLASVTIPNSVTTIGESAFRDCSGLTSVTIGNSVTSIDYYAFQGCSGLTEITIPNSVTSISGMAFKGCIGLTEITIPASVTSIKSRVFEGCIGLEKMSVEDGNPKYDSRENCNAIISTKSNELIAGCKNTIIPGSVTYIGMSAFQGCSGLTELTIPGSVTSIESQAFHDCSGLTTLYSLNTTPPSAYTSTFDTNHYTNVDVFVPAEALEAYQTANEWKDFKKLQAIGSNTAIAKVSTNGEQIQSANGQITVTGLTDGTTVAVYDLSGQQVGTATSTGGQATVSTGLTIGTAAIVKMGDNKSVKVAVK